MSMMFGSQGALYRATWWARRWDIALGWHREREARGAGPPTAQIGEGISMLVGVIVGLPLTSRQIAMMATARRRRALERHHFASWSRLELLVLGGEALPPRRARAFTDDVDEDEGD